MKKALALVIAATMGLSSAAFAEDTVAVAQPNTNSTATSSSDTSTMTSSPTVNSSRKNSEKKHHQKNKTEKKATKKDNATDMK